MGTAHENQKLIVYLKEKNNENPFFDLLGLSALSSEIVCPVSNKLDLFRLFHPPPLGGTRSRKKNLCLRQKNRKLKLFYSICGNNFFGFSLWLGG